MYFEGSQELLHVIAAVLDIRSVFPCVSEIANRMVPHDALTMASQDEDLNVQRRTGLNGHTNLDTHSMVGAMAPEADSSHGGRLWATANAGRGATFHFTMPRAAANTPRVATPRAGADHSALSFL